MRAESVEHVGVVIELASRRLPIDRERPLGDVGLGDREVDEEVRVAVADVGALVWVVEADRDLDADSAWWSEAAPEPGADPAGDHGEDDVVDSDRTVDCLAGRARRIERDRGERDGPPGAHVSGEWRAHRGRRELARDGLLAHPGARLARRSAGKRRQPLGAPSRLIEETAGEQLERPRRRCRRPSRRCDVVDDIRRRPPQQRVAEPHARRAVREAMVESPDERHRVLVETRDDREVPQRPSAVEPLAHQPADDLVEPGAALDRQVLDGGDVAGDVERRIVEPHRIRNAQRRRHDPLAQPSGRVEARGDVSAHGGERRQRPISRSLEDEHLARMAADRAALELEDPGVLRGEPIKCHRVRPHRDPP